MYTSLRNLFAVLLVSVSATAFADFVVVAEAYEVARSDLRLPGTANGTLALKECDTCDYRTIRATSGTRYEANGEALSLQDFSEALEDLPSNVTVTVLHHLESDTITAVQVWF